MENMMDLQITVCDDDGWVAPTKEVMDAARKLAAFSQIGPPDSAVSGPLGEVLLEWRTAEKYVEAEIVPDASAVEFMEIPTGGEAIHKTWRLK